MLLKLLQVKSSERQRHYGHTEIVNESYYSKTLAVLQLL